MSAASWSGLYYHQPPAAPPESLSHSASFSSADSHSELELWPVVPSSPSSPLAFLSASWDDGSDDVRSTSGSVNRLSSIPRSPPFSTPPAARAAAELLPQAGSKRRRVPAPHSPAAPVVEFRSHRELDAQRRQLEAEAIDQLTELTQPSSSSSSSASSSHPLSKRHKKLDVLRASAARIRELEALCASQTASLAAKDRAVRALHVHMQHLLDRLRASTSSPSSSSSSSSPYSRSSLSPPPASVLAYIAQSDERRALTASLSSRFGLLLVNAANKHVLEANEQYHAITGWTAYDIETRQRNPPPPPPGSQYRGPPHCRTAPSDADASALQRWRGARPIRQWPRALRLYGELYAGERQWMHEQWRFRFRDGRLMEIDLAAWVARTEERLDERGQCRLLPQQLILCLGHQSPVPVDESG